MDSKKERLNEMVGILARLGRERRFPLMLDKAWARATGVNPVAAAICLEADAKAQKRNKVAFFHDIMLVAAVIILMWQSRGYDSDLLQMPPWMTVLFLMLLGGFICSIMFYSPRDPMDVSGTETVVRDFCDKLCMFCFWSPAISMSVVDDLRGIEKLTSLTENQIRELGTAVLAQCACHILEFEEEKKPYDDLGKKLEWEITKGKLYQELESRYFILHLIGTVSGGPQKYFAAGADLYKEKKLRIQKVLS